jgi:hypothetical protein
MNEICSSYRGLAFPFLIGGRPFSPNDGAGGYGGGGGGGGYSGGGAGDNAFDESAGGGGASFDSGTDPLLLAGVRSGNGEVTITFLTGVNLVLEPSSFALVGVDLFGLGFLRRRKASA